MAVLPPRPSSPPRSGVGPNGSRARAGCVGRAVSVLVLGNGDQAVSLAASEQWCDPLPERPYRYGGAAAPAELSPELRAGAERLAAASGLRGLGSVDAIVDGASYWVLELNL